MPVQLSRLSPTALLRHVAEAVLLFMVVWAPWPFGSITYAWESLLIGGVAIITILWFVHAYFQGELRIRPDPVLACLLGLVLITGLQLVPLPESVVGMLSSKRLQLHRELNPVQLEQLPGETGDIRRETWLPLSFDPFLTRVFLAQLLSITLLYFVVRSWIASRESLYRFAWLATANGILLAILGITQFFSSPRNTVYWSVETEGAVFGPFICKNHFPDYVLFCLGLGAGLMAARQAPSSVKIKGVEYRMNTLASIGNSPDVFVIGCGLVLMVLSIPFTLSRGGLLAAFAAAAVVAVLVVRTRGALSKGFAIGGGIVAAALLIGSWYGWGVVSDRLDTLWTGKATVTRNELWRDLRTIIPDFLVAGGGGGAFIRFEAITRTEPSPEFHEMNNAHNEYLEALLEGGVLRLALTIALCWFSLRAAYRAYDRLKERSTGPLMLGILFGQIALIVHCVVDFGIHVPAVALMAAVATAFAADGFTDPTYVPFRKKSGQAPERDPGRITLRGPAIFALALPAAALCGWLVYDASNRGLSEELQRANRDAQRADAERLLDLRLNVLNEAVRHSPNDGVAWSMLAQAHLEAAERDCRFAAMALAGGALPSGLPQDLFIRPGGDHVRQGLAAARAARRRSPLLTRPHWFMALYADGFARSEPSRKHFDRATITAPTDARLRLDLGSEAARRGDMPAAIAEWQKSMSLNPWLVPQVLQVASRHLSSEQILSPLLPPNPVVIHAAMEQLHPWWLSGQEAARQPFLMKIVALDHRGEWPARGWAAIARAHAELGSDSAALAAWRKVLELEPDNYDLRNQLSRWYEETERYAEAEEHLAWLRQQKDSNDLRDRFDAVRHARKLRDIIEGR